MFLRIFSTVFLLLFTAWGGAAIWFDGPESRIIAGILSGSFTAASVGSLLVVRPIGRALVVSALLCLGVLAWWQSIAPSNDRDWQPAMARLARAHIDGDRITIENVRNFDYRSDSEFTEHWETRSYDLRNMVGVDMFLSYWGPRMIAHTIVSWQFADGQHLAISIETRKVKGQSYSAIRGFFRQYELVYVVAEERDIIGVRTNSRGEDVYLYRLATPPDQARAVLLDYLTEINRLVDHPTWYNALLHNCTTTIRHEVLPVAPHNPFNWRILLNGYLDRLGYDRGVINTSMPFDELRRSSNITAAAKRADQAPNFSELIREGLPSRPDWVRLSGS
jgi:hypothetical protein